LDKHETQGFVQFAPHGATGQRNAA